MTETKSKTYTDAAYIWAMKHPRILTSSDPVSRQHNDRLEKIAKRLENKDV